MRVQWGGPTLMRPPVVKRQTPPRSGLANFLPLRVQAARRAPLAPCAVCIAVGWAPPARPPTLLEARSPVSARVQRATVSRAAASHHLRARLAAAATQARGRGSPRSERERAP